MLKSFYLFTLSYDELAETAEDIAAAAEELAAVGEVVDGGVLGPLLGVMAGLLCQHHARHRPKLFFQLLHLPLLLPLHVACLSTLGCCRRSTHRGLRRDGDRQRWRDMFRSRG